MKKKIVIIIALLFVIAGCKKVEKINYVKKNWELDQSLKPTFEIERSNKNDDGFGVFYVDSQLQFDKFKEYLETLKGKNFKIDWRYSDVDTIEKLQGEYESEKEDGIFSDGYINFQMCTDEVCFFMQWVDKDLYNSLNKDNPTTYSFKLETINLIKSDE